MDGAGAAGGVPAIRASDRELQAGRLDPRKGRRALDLFRDNGVLLVENAYPRDLIASHGGGILTPLNDVMALTEAVADLGQDRASLARLIGRAAQDGAGFDDISIFKHRADLIKTHLGSPA